MRVLVIGNGGREHALVWKIAQSPLVHHIYCAPGNAGIAKIAECVPIAPIDLNGLADFAEQQRIDLTVVGPEAPLIAGIVDRFESRGLPIFGPSPDPAQIEGSKAFSKKLMQASGIPTAAFWICDSLSMAQTRVDEYYAAHGPAVKIVIKADGLAAGKGVIVAKDRAEARAALERIMGDRIFGDSGDKVVIEECLEGPEASIMALTDGDALLALLPSQDHKRALEGDQGPNTGGMGAYCPVPVMSPELTQRITETILQPAINAICELGLPYRGLLYAGVILTSDGPKCIEFNCRFGDPETQAVLPLLESDLVPLLLRSLDGTMDQAEAIWRQGASVCVVAAAGGYPGDYEIGKEIIGLNEAENEKGCVVFHAGTRQDHDTVVTAGGRVLGVTGVGDNISEAVQHAYNGIDQIHFEGMHYRRDIAARALR